MKTIKYLRTTVLFLTTVLAAPLATASETPFRGTMQAVETQEGVFPILSVDGTGGGKSTHLGNFTMTYEADVVAGMGSGSMELIAANGDRVFADFTGRSTPTETPGVVTIVETATITGGTGRFAGATGTFVVTRTLYRNSGITSGHLDGTIVLPNGK